MRRALMIAVAALVVAGCGNEPGKPPDVSRIAAPGGFEDSTFRDAGVFLRTPQAWRIQKGNAPYQVALISKGAGQIAVWRYPRSEPLPETEPQLRSARDELVKAVKARDSNFDVTDTRVVMKPGIKAVEIVGVGTNQGERRKARSLHAYGENAEIVVDAYAPAAQFDRVDAQTFAPLARSLKLSKPQK